MPPLGPSDLTDVPSAERAPAAQRHATAKTAAARPRQAGIGSAREIVAAESLVWIELFPEIRDGPFKSFGYRVKFCPRFLKG
jgi:hypothetical protein